MRRATEPGAPERVVFLPLVEVEAGRLVAFGSSDMPPLVPGACSTMMMSVTTDNGKQRIVYKLRGTTANPDDGLALVIHGGVKRSLRIKEGRGTSLTPLLECELSGAQWDVRILELKGVPNATHLVLESDGNQPFVVGKAVYSRGGRPTSEDLGVSAGTLRAMKLAGESNTDCFRDMVRMSIHRAGLGHLLPQKVMLGLLGDQKMSPDKESLLRHIDQAFSPSSGDLPIKNRIRSLSGQEWEPFLKSGDLPQVLFLDSPPILNPADAVIRAKMMGIRILLFRKTGIMPVMILRSVSGKDVEVFATEAHKKWPGLPIIDLDQVGQFLSRNSQLASNSGAPTQAQLDEGLAAGVAELKARISHEAGEMRPREEQRLRDMGPGSAEKRQKILEEMRKKRQ
jgi:hypothetical protein